MALIVETGAIVANANSFTTDAELVAYAASRGVTLPATEAERDQLQIKAVDYLQMQDWQGEKQTYEQALDWPRYGVSVGSWLVPSDSIPKELKFAQMELAIAAQTINLLPNQEINNVQREKLDVMEVAYFKGGSKNRVNLSAANGWISKLLNPTDRVCRS